MNITTGTEVTVVVCTRNRGHAIRSTIESILASDVEDFELLIIDQSPGDETELVVRPYLVDVRVRYLRSSEVGVARSRTQALHEAQTEFLINTDDDCIVEPNWVRQNLLALQAHPNAALVYGDVVSPPHAAEEEGFAPESVADEDFTVRSIWGWRTTDGANIGIGASMAMRRSMLLDLGGFDHELGPGSTLGTAEETDISLRAVLAGHEIVRSTAPRVIHHGMRRPEEFRNLTRVASFSIGAVCGKVIRRHPLAGMCFGAKTLYGLVIRVAIVDLAHGRKPPVLGRATHLVKGFARGLRMPLDSSTHILFAESPDRG